MKVHVICSTNDLRIPSVIRRDLTGGAAPCLPAVGATASDAHRVI